MSGLLLFIFMIISGVIWLYDEMTHARVRRQADQKEPAWVGYARGIFLLLVIIMLIKFFNVGILLLLVILTFGSLVIWLVDKYCFLPARILKNKKEPLLVDYARSLFPIFLIVLLVRSFLFQPFRVPTGSLEPTVMPNDFVVVSQYAYGLRLPVINTKIVNIGEPKHGDIVVFRYPVDPSVDFVKRAIGLPGDHVVYKDKVLYINGQEMKQTFLRDGEDVEPTGNIPSKVMEEDLFGIKHEILLHNDGGETEDFDIVIPQGYYFMMGDNRDGSADSRIWGYVPEANLIGKALVIWLSFDHGIRWSRMGTKL